MRYLILCLFLISCGNGSNKSKNYFNDPYFNDLKEDFIEYIEENSNISEIDKWKIQTIPIFFEKMEGKAGYCSNRGYIAVDQVYKTELYKQYIRKLVFHELGHCILNLEHDDNPYDLMFYRLNLLDFTKDFIYRWEQKRGY